MLVNGARGGGGYAVQLAKYAGAYVVATASRRSAGAVRRLGADLILDYTAGPLTLDEPVDALLHLVPDPVAGGGTAGPAGRRTCLGDWAGRGRGRPRTGHRKPRSPPR